MAETGESRGHRLRTERERKGWSRRTLADKSGTSEATVARVELYGHEAKLDAWDSWAAVLEVPLADLIAPDPEAAA